MVRTRITVSAGEALMGTLIAVINSRLWHVLPVSPCSSVGLDHRALRSHPAGAFWAEPVLHRPEAHCHRPIGAASAGGEPQLRWVHDHGACLSWETSFYPHLLCWVQGALMKTTVLTCVCCLMMIMWMLVIQNGLILPLNAPKRISFCKHIR